MQPTQGPGSMLAWLAPTEGWRGALLERSPPLQGLGDGWPQGIGPVASRPMGGGWGSLRPFLYVTTECFIAALALGVL